MPTWGRGFKFRLRPFQEVLYGELFCFLGPELNLSEHGFVVDHHRARRLRLGSSTGRQKVEEAGDISQA